ncbi:MAG: aldo/keto reductase [Gammaproteobacteria bacterium]|nr:aldo/keto reductase [Gammaproteobacteria bacterium]
MQYRRFGRTELSMPVFSCGGMRYQHSWKDVPESEIPAKNQQNLEATISRSLELGINHIETARGYGTSELQLGKYLRTLPRESFYFQTKAVPTKDPKEFLETFETSMQTHGLEHADLFSFHGVNTLEVLEDAKGCLDAARQLQRDGRIRFLGFSTHGHVDTICQAIDTGEFDYLNLHWYWIFQNNWPAILRAKAQDMGVFIISPSDKGGMLYQPTAAFSACTAPHSPMMFNDLFCLNHPEVHTLSLGASCPEDFDEHLKALSVWDKRKTYLATAESSLHQRISDTVGSDWWTYVTQELPEWWEVPGEVNLRIILWLWSLDQAFGMREYAQSRYNLLGNASHWFPGQQITKLDTDKLSSLLKDSEFLSYIPERLQQAHEWFLKEETKRLSESE